MQNELVQLGETRSPVERGLFKIDIAFDKAANDRGDEILIRHVTSDCESETRWFKFAELRIHEPRVTAARKASDSDLLLPGVFNHQSFARSPVYGWRARSGASIQLKNGVRNRCAPKHGPTWGSIGGSLFDFESTD
jgi:hypothetical protein